MAQVSVGVRGQPQELVLTLFGAYVQPRNRAVWSGGLVALLGEFGISPGAARVALTRLAARGMLGRAKAGRLVSYSITPRTAAILAEGDDRIFSLGQAQDDGDVWTVLWHTVPEDRRLDRSRLTRRLRFLGFGAIQDGAWIAPRDHEKELANLLAELGLLDHASVFVGRPSAALDPHRLVTRAWDLDGLAARYDEFVAQYGRFDAAARGRLTGRQALQLHAQIVHTFRQFPSLDPELPTDLVPPPPSRSRAIALFHDLYAALGPSAQQYFEQVTSP
ncbi:MAG TPA: PaaX family transcriptional regulator C-terminal domain-containing protein [Jiangellaceae bacterium]